MKLEDAKKIIRDDKASAIGWIAATAEIVKLSEDNPDFFDDLLQCLKRGGPCAGPAIAALYWQSGRKVPEKRSDYSRDPDEWRSFLTEAGFLKTGGA